MAEDKIKQSEKPTPKQANINVSIRSIYEELDYSDQLVVYSHYRERLDELVDKEVFLTKIKAEKAKVLGR